MKNKKNYFNTVSADVLKNFMKDVVFEFLFRIVVFTRLNMDLVFTDAGSAPRP